MPDPLPVAAAPHNNHQLFSDHYLNYTLPHRADWAALREAAGPVRDKIAALFQDYAPSDNEAQTEDDFIKPVLKALGHDFEVQPALRTPDGTKKPDYVFYRDLPARNANKRKTLTDALPQQGCFAVGDAKYWQRSLDVTLKDKAKSADLFTNKTPGYQIAFYIQHSGVEWGILTNGRLWRLYHRDTAHKLDRFYEVDLPALLHDPDPNAFSYFYGFFHRTAWWTLDFAGLQTELVKVFKKAIPVKERDEWEAWFEEQRAAHTRYTDAIIARETALNARVYALFGLEEAEIRIIEAATKYRYGEV